MLHLSVAVKGAELPEEKNVSEGESSGAQAGEARGAARRQPGPKPKATYEGVAEVAAEYAALGANGRAMVRSLVDWKMDPSEKRAIGVVIAASQDLSQQQRELLRAVLDGIDKTNPLPPK